MFNIIAKKKVNWTAPLMQTTVLIHKILTKILWLGPPEQVQWCCSGKNVLFSSVRILKLSWKNAEWLETSKWSAVVLFLDGTCFLASGDIPKCSPIPRLKCLTHSPHSLAIRSLKWKLFPNLVLFLNIISISQWLEVFFNDFFNWVLVIYKIFRIAIF